jgi:succinyl-CoA synthetase beta subunit
VRPAADAVAALLGQARRQGRRALDEPTGKRLLEAYGIAVPRSARVDDPGRLEAALAALSPPYVLKVVSPDVLHKSDSGGVRLGLADAAAVRDAMRAMADRIVRDGHRLDGFLVEETAPAGHDIVIGGFRDPSFGQVVMVGLGGVFVELLHDVAFRICPITRLDAREMIDELKGAPILDGARGGCRVPVSVVVDALMAFAGEGGLLVELAECFAEVDVNPLIVGAAGAVAVDARFVLVPESDDVG